MGWLLFFHIVGVVLFLGNIVTAAFWKLKAESSQDLRIILQSARMVMLADYVFTLPGIAIILLTGHLLAIKAGYSLLDLSWLSVSYGLFILSGVIWVVVLLPTQHRMIKQAALSIQEGSLTSEYRRASTMWNVFGSLSTVLPIAVLLLMAAKPF